MKQMKPLHLLDDLQKTYRLLVETFQDITKDNIRASGSGWVIMRS